MPYKPKRLLLEEYKFIYSKVPRLCVDLIIQTKEGIVLTKRDIRPYKGMWHLPGGTVLFRESIKSASSRIAKEEVGIKIKIEKVLGVMEFPREPNGFHAVSLGLLAVIASGKPRGSFQAKKVQTFRQIPKNTISGHKKFLLSNFESLQ